MIQGGGQVVINLLANVKQQTIEPLMKETIVSGTLVYTDEYNIYAACRRRDTIIRASTMDEANSLAMKMATVCVKCMCIQWKVSGRS